MVEIILEIPESLIEHAKRLGSATQRDVSTVIIDTLEMLWLTVEGFPNPDLSLPVLVLSDDEVLVLANSKMDDVQNQRLGDLQAKGKVTRLTEAERYELLALLQIYQLGQLRKLEALAETIRRGLQKPLPG